MSAEMSAAEKQKILRERRKQKFAKSGGSGRLNKIVGKSDSLLSTESPLDQKASIGNSSNEDNSASTTEMEQLISNVHSNTQKSSNKTKSEPEIDPALKAQLDMFKQFAQQQQQEDQFGGLPGLNGSASGAGAGAGAGANGLPAMPDLFSQLAKGFPGADGTGAGSGADIFGGANPFMDAAPMVPPEVVQYHTATLNQYKARNTFIKWVFILLPYLYFVTHPEFLSTLSTENTFLIQLLSKSNFFTVLTTLEIISISLYYQFKQKLSRKTQVTATSESKILGLLKMIPEGIIPITNLHGKVNLVFQYLDVFNLFVVDLCFCLIVMGIMTYIHNLH
ncbi:hypothetical protein ACO0QE_004319 [Hanseniaspora vineae]